jgi:hypothetical protein
MSSRQAALIAAGLLLALATCALVAVTLFALGLL